ncbi:hypothetical protein NXX23_24245 [Bacteroides ovatus]|nr:hypothetical protein [Bacteroides ovatus]
MPDQDVYPSVDSDGKLITDIDWVSPDEEKGIRGLYPSVRNIDPFSVQVLTREMKDIRIATAWLLPTSASP